MPPAESTILDAKASFIRTQVRLLSAPLHPTSSWRDTAPATEDSAPSDRTIDNVISKVNDKIKSHNRSIFSAQTQRHVAEQLDTLYWNAVQEEINETQSRDAVVVKRHVDLHSSETLGGLPESAEDLWLDPDVGRSRMSDDQKEEYTALHARLASLTEQRDMQQKRLARYQALQKLLRPFENAKENVQPNLVTKDGELAKEMERMWVLLAKVTGKVAQMPVPPMRVGDKEEAKEDADTINERKLRDLMDLT